MHILTKDGEENELCVKREVGGVSIYPFNEHQLTWQSVRVDERPGSRPQHEPVTDSQKIPNIVRATPPTELLPTCQIVGWSEQAELELSYQEQLVWTFRPSLAQLANNELGLSLAGMAWLAFTMSSHRGGRGGIRTRLSVQGIPYFLNRKARLNDQK